MKRVFIIHGWGGHPNEGWLLWLRKELQERGIEVVTPEMPNTNHPKITEWIDFLAAQVGKVDEDTYFVGHSIGCQTILRYLQRLDESEKSGGVIFVAPWLDKEGSLHLYDEQEREIAKPWIEEPINLEAVKSHANKFVGIFSDNDECVPLHNKLRFENDLGAETFIEHSKGHFTEEDSVFQIPLVLEKLLEMMPKKE